MATMSRVDISGQFNIDNALCAGSRPIRIERDPATLSTAGIAGWGAFCDEVDEALTPLAGIRTRLKIFGALLYASILLVVLVFNLVARDLLKYSAAAIYPCVFVYTFVYCRARREVVAVMEGAGEVCKRRSAGGVRYGLESEHWGGCNKPHVKRWYIEVEMIDEETAKPAVVEVAKNENDATMDREEDQPTKPAGDMTVSEYFSSTQPDATTDSLMDMLKS